MVVVAGLLPLFLVVGLATWVQAMRSRERGGSPSEFAAD
jgi:hypothetical protein